MARLVSTTLPLISGTYYWPEDSVEELAFFAARFVAKHKQARVTLYPTCYVQFAEHVEYYARPAIGFDKTFDKVQSVVEEIIEYRESYEFEDKYTGTGSKGCIIAITSWFMSIYKSTDPRKIKFSAVDNPQDKNHPKVIEAPIFAVDADSIGSDYYNHRRGSFWGALAACHIRKSGQNIHSEKMRVECGRWLSQNKMPWRRVIHQSNIKYELNQPWFKGISVKCYSSRGILIGKTKSAGPSDPDAHCLILRDDGKWFITGSAFLKTKKDKTSKCPCDKCGNYHTDKKPCKTYTSPESPDLKSKPRPSTKCDLVVYADYESII